MTQRISTCLLFGEYLCTEVKCNGLLPFVFVIYFFLNKEARETILSFTKNAEELLKRKKVHRDIIFKYLAKEGVAMPPSSEKQQLVKRTLELWSTAKVGVILKYLEILNVIF